jgi:DNA-binding MarR family transcriptional regulator
MAMTTFVKEPDQSVAPRAREMRTLPDHLLRWLEAAQRRVAGELDTTADEVLRRVPQRRLRILQLVPPEGARQQDLAERALVTKQAIAELVDALESEGLVARTPDPHDGRAWLVTRSARGRRVSESLDAAMRVVEDELASSVGAARYETFKEVLREIGEGQI